MDEHHAGQVWFLQCCQTTQLHRTTLHGVGLTSCNLLNNTRQGLGDAPVADLTLDTIKNLFKAFTCLSLKMTDVIPCCVRSQSA